MENTKKNNICLNMIVKNEEHVIEETLNCIYKYIDYYVISDTGSTDKTMEVIKNFFDKVGIKGEIHQNKWKNFGHNRSIALDLCKNKSKYIWVIDADDIIVGNIIFPENMDKDCYQLKYGDSFTYYRSQIFKNSDKLNWKYVGVLHEYPSCDKHQYTKEIITGDYYVDSRRLGDRSKDPYKYIKDAKILEEGIRDEPDNERYYFYCGQSYFDASIFESSIKYYTKRIEMGGWYEEVFYSYYKIAEAKHHLKRSWEEVEKAYLDAYNFLPIRAEPLHKIAEHYRLAENFEKAYEFAKKASKINYPSNCVLFIFKDVYEYKVLDELSIAAYYTDRYLESYEICNQLLKKNLPLYVRDRIIDNRKSAEFKLKTIEKMLAVIYVGEIILSDDDIEFINKLKKYFRIILVGNKINENVIDMDDNESIIIDCEYFNQNKSKIDIDTLIHYDNLNFFMNKNYGNEIPLTNAKINILIQKDYIFKFVLEDNIQISLNNNNILNSVLNSVDKILTLNEQSLSNQISSIYNIDNNFVHYVDNDNIFELVNKHDSSTKNKKISVKCEKKSNNGKNSINGFIVNFPKYINNNNIICRNLGLKKDYYIRLIDILKKHSEPFYLFGLYLLENNENVKDVLNYLNIALSLLDDSDQSFKLMIKCKISECYNKLEQWEKSFELCNSIMKNSYGLLDSYELEMLENIRDATIEKLENKYISYPDKIIDKIVEHINPKNKSKKGKTPKIILTITTCKRFDLFEKTINSFIQCCNDILKIDKWVCIDDNSSKADRNKMKTLYPFFDFVFKNEDNKGHFKSINMIYDIMVSKNGPEYLIHLEDDWKFFEKRNYIEECIKIFKNDDKIGQVLFNKNYSEVEFTKKKIKGGIRKKVKNGPIYLEHEYFDDPNKYPGYYNVGYWPHFSFRPSLWNCKYIKNVGPFYNTYHFEMAYAYDYYASGYKSAFLDTFCSIHIGKKTWEGGKNNAYLLNNEQQFYTGNEFINNVVMGCDIKKWQKFKNINRDKLDFYIKHTIMHVENLDKDQKDIFVPNNFNYRRDILDRLNAHLNLWKNIDRKYLLILDENCILGNDFKEKYNELIKKLQKMDKSNEKYDLINLGNGGYIIEKKAGDRLYHFAKEIKIKDSLDIFFKQSADKKIIKIENYDKIVDMTIEMKEIPKLDGYKFYCQLDSLGNDVDYVGKLPLEELKKIADKNKNCKGFNTLGYLKHEIAKEEQFVYLIYSPELWQGLYVKCDEE